MPSPRACSITFQPSRPGSIRSSTQTSGRSKRRRASPVSPFATPTASNPADWRCRAMPWAMTSSSSMIKTFVMRGIMATGGLPGAVRLLPDGNEPVTTGARRSASASSGHGRRTSVLLQAGMDSDTRRGRMLIEESREAVIVLDDYRHRRAREPARPAVDRRDQRGRRGPRRAPLRRPRDRAADRPLRGRRPAGADRLPQPGPAT